MRRVARLHTYIMLLLQRKNILVKLFSIAFRMLECSAVTTILCLVESIESGSDAPIRN